ncbi:ORF6N domain-containing protein [Clostridium amylolyticum]|uniref:ORF6N domain-containing protein n=1 Tax=Clostridium amylolyticum TaxID=1121298 RepID=A0A1M6F0I8_9CLOT|nr:ORF6N domain-containing protein [Clostridium amylolyticum]SHI91202.1 ORF6N domain-containing protein [Clostridium amylolyticum]
MTNLVKIKNQDLQVKEFNGQRIITFKDIDNLHERVDGTSRKNFSNNKKHFIDGLDYFEIKKSEVGEEFSSTFGFDKFAPIGFLITESGYLMLVKSLTDDLAWQVQRELVNNYFRAKEAKPSCIEDLIIMQAQALKDLREQLNQANNNALDAKAGVEKTKQEIQSMRDVYTLNPNSWRSDTTKLINAIAQKLGGFDHIRDVREESYKLLDERAGARLGIRLSNMKKNVLAETGSISKSKKVTKLDVIGVDKRLIEVYCLIVKEMAIKYGAA